MVLRLRWERFELSEAADARPPLTCPIRASRLILQDLLLPTWTASSSGPPAEVAGLSTGGRLLGFLSRFDSGASHISPADCHQAHRARPAPRIVRAYLHSERLKAVWPRGRRIVLADDDVQRAERLS